MSTYPFTDPTRPGPVSRETVIRCGSCPARWTLHPGERAPSGWTWSVRSCSWRCSRCNQESTL